MMPARLSKLLSNIFGSGATRAVNLGVSLLMVPILLSSVGEKDYAILAAVTSLSMMVAFADLGLSLSLVNNIARAESGSSNSVEKDKILHVFAALIFISCAVVSSCAVAALGCLLLGIDSASSWGGLLAVAVIGASIPTGLVQRILFAQQRSLLANASLSGSKVLSLIAVSVIAAMGVRNVFIYQLAILLPQGFVNAGLTWLVLRRDFAVVVSDLVRALNCRIAEVVLLVKGSIKYVLFQLTPYVESGVDALVIALFVGYAFVPAYDVHSKVYALIPAAASVALFPVWPSVSAAYGAKDRAWIDRVWRFGMILTVLCTSAAALAVVFTRDLFIPYWTKSALTLPSSTNIALATFAVLSCIGTFQSMMLSGVGAVNRQLNALFHYCAVLIVAKCIVAKLYGVEAMVWTCNLLALLRLLYFWMLFNGERKESRLGNC